MRQSASGERARSHSTVFARASGEGTYRWWCRFIYLSDLSCNRRTGCRRTGRAIKHLARQRADRPALFEPYFRPSGSSLGLLRPCHSARMGWAKTKPGIATALCGNEISEREQQAVTKTHPMKDER